MNANTTNTNTAPRTFHTDLERGKIGEDLFQAYLDGLVEQGTFLRARRTEHTEYVGMSWETDFKAQLPDGSIIYLEVKTLAGGYKTFCVEAWADDKMQRRPGWFRTSEAGQTIHVAFIDMSANKMYIHDGAKLAAHIKNYKGSLRRAGNNCLHDSGWLVLVPWTNSHTLRTVVDLADLAA